MSLVAEIRVRARHVVGPVLGLCAAGYFAYHAVNGDRGLIAWLELQKKIEAAHAVAAEVAARREALEHRVKLLHPEGIDPDLLEERARRMLNYGYPDEIVILVEKDRK